LPCPANFPEYKKRMIFKEQQPPNKPACLVKNQSYVSSSATMFDKITFN